MVFVGFEIAQVITEKYPNKQLKNADGLATEYLEKTIPIEEDVVIEIGLPTLVKN